MPDDDTTTTRDLAAVEQATDYLKAVPLEDRVPGYGGGLSEWDKEQVLGLLGGWDDES